MKKNLKKKNSDSIVQAAMTAAKKRPTTCTPLESTVLWRPRYADCKRWYLVLFGNTDWKSTLSKTIFLNY